MYMDFLEACKCKILIVFKILLVGEEIVIVNCKHSKDRTGLICMLVMLLCDIPDEKIVLEYSRSFDNLNVGRNKERMIDDMKSCGLSEEFVYSKQEYMFDLLKEFRYKYKSVNHYLDSLGFNHSDQDLFVKKFKI